MSANSDVLKSMSGERLGVEQDPALVPGPDFRAAHLASFEAVVRARRSIRVYTGEPIPEETMRAALRAAILAPSSSNLQSYEIHWVRDPVKRGTLAEACLGQPAATTAGELLVVVARHDNWRENLSKLLRIMQSGGAPLPKSVTYYYETMIPRVMASDPFGFRNLARRLLFAWTGLWKPMVRSPVSEADFRIFGHTQASLAAQTLMLSLTAHGYDTCPIGGMDARRIHRLLGLPRRAEVVMVISAGTRKPEGLYGPQIRLEERELIKEV
jgi:nitroreductase